MSTKSKAINVKIPTAKIIAALEQALNKLELDYTSQEKLEEEYTKAYEQWRKTVTDIAIANSDKALNLRINNHSWKGTFNIDYDIDRTQVPFPDEPERNHTRINQHEYRDMKEEISNAVRILKMTDEEVVSTSTYNSVAKYL